MKNSQNRISNKMLELDFPNYDNVPINVQVISK